MLKAKKIYITDFHTEDNVFCGFYKNIELDALLDEAVLSVTGRTFYKIYINGAFVSYGPARSAHECCRVDFVDVSSYLRVGKNAISIELISHLRSTLSTTGEESFLQLEITAADEVLLFTDIDWQASLLDYRKRIVPVASHARNASESYNLKPDYDSWHINGFTRCNALSVLESEIALLDSPYECFDFTVKDDANRTYISFDHTYTCYDFGVLECGFLIIDITLENDSTVELICGNKITRNKGEYDHDFNPIRPITLNCAGGRYVFEAFEPTDIRYVRVKILGGNYKINSLSMRRCQTKDIDNGYFVCGDPDINRIYTACRHSLVINTFDTFMDCPGRERGGWTADAYWTSQAARMMFGNTITEKCHLENMLSPTIKKYFGNLPACYPAGNTIIIHNWTIMFLHELYGYYRFTADDAFMQQRRQDVEWVVWTLSKYKNKFGLLENLDKFTYVDGTTSLNEGSDINKEFNIPISSATNAMYAAILKQLGEYYNNKEWISDADSINTILKKLCNITMPEYGTQLIPDAFSIDDKGNITPGSSSSESSQYFMMLCGIAVRAEMPEYFRQMFDMFGMAPSEPITSRNITRFRYTSDFHMGTNARIEVLAKNGEIGKLITEIKKFGLYMIDNGAGVMWEGFGWHSGISHGFVSWYGYILEREISGLNMPDVVSKTVRITPHYLEAKWARSYLETEKGIFSVYWTKTEDEFTLTYEIPDGFKADLTVPIDVRSWNYKRDGNTLRFTRTELPTIELQNDGCII